MICVLHCDIDASHSKVTSHGYITLHLQRANVSLYIIHTLTAGERYRSVRVIVGVSAEFSLFSSPTNLPASLERPRPILGMKFARLSSPPRRLHQFRTSRIHGILKTTCGTAGRNSFQESRETDKDIVGFRPLISRSFGRDVVRRPYEMSLAYPRPRENE